MMMLHCVPTMHITVSVLCVVMSTDHVVVALAHPAPNIVCCILYTVAIRGIFTQQLTMLLLALAHILVHYWELVSFKIFFF